MAEAAAQPLYAQVKALIIRRISKGDWKPGAMIPNEFQLAAEYQVSQGTVRKALIALEAERLIVRRQGRGTFVARHTREIALFHFFRMTDLGGTRVTPSSIALSQKLTTATKALAELLEVPRSTSLHAITRVRTLKSVPAIFERIYVPVSLMPDLAIETNTDMLDEMYVIYQERYGITISQASERLAAVAALPEDAKHLGLAQATPLLEITRQGRDINHAVAEIRISRCRTDLFRYATEVV
jgi:GntR family transcriptional regulator